MKKTDGLGPATLLILLVCNKPENHGEEPCGVYVHGMQITLWDKTLMYFDGPIPRAVWLNVFQPVKMKVLMSPCDLCKILL